ncbi:hypothetical protein QBC38DRAFT_480540 [Podospora fimiseda]|uniref:TauD/TfdA-like domain-containing protein n=1 Tax=Podospora fimiseda TaxID=252190 RepID=A0AAN7BN29_9PEZI|nr:hypothetical protein QBC38DRAFT_480540 [Podospora fimiseda]
MPAESTRTALPDGKDASTTKCSIPWLQAGHHPMAWKPDDFRYSHSYVIEINKEEEREVQEGLNKFLELGLDGHETTTGGFELPGLKDKLLQVCHEVHRGRGFVIVRGLGLSKQDADNITMFLGVSDHIGSQRGRQSKLRGYMIQHITDPTTLNTAYSQRHGIHTPADLEWHTDMGPDILALHVRSLAEEGGDTFIAPSFTIYQELVKDYPEVVETLCGPWPIQLSTNPIEYSMAPLLHVGEDRILLSFDPGRLVHRSTAPLLSMEQKQALRVVADLADKFRLRLDMKPGDMVFINQWSTLHSRASYVDAKDGPRRHLVRLHLRNPELAWPIPQVMRGPMERAFGKDGNGHGHDGVRDRYPVTPQDVVSAPPRYTAGSAACDN